MHESKSKDSWSILVTKFKHISHTTLPSWSSEFFTPTLLTKNDTLSEECGNVNAQDEAVTGVSPQSQHALTDIFEPETKT